MATQGLVKTFIITVTYGGVICHVYSFRQKRKAKEFFVRFIMQRFPNETETKLNEILNADYGNHWTPHWQNFEGYFPHQKEHIDVVLQESSMKEI